MSVLSENAIRSCMLADQHRLRRSLQTLRRSPDPAAETALAARIEQSQRLVAQRQAAIPKVELAPGLPISDKRDLIANALEKNQIIIVAGETGSGKTTQIPKICLQLGYGARGLIGHTQPRRLAARSVASRIADELGQTLGKAVGYQVRFSDNTDASTWIKLMTDGILLAEIQQDRFLNKYEVLIIDEAHERSLNIDFLLGYLKQLAKRRPELKIIVTSATIDVDKFSEHFDKAPVISVSGRSFPVEIIYSPSGEDSEETNQEDPQSAAVITAIHQIEERERTERRRPGDILVFLSGEREIRDLAQALRKAQLRNTEVLPLYARLSQAEQKRIFESHSGRRIILSTNVAETSLTVPGIIYVIDTGLARISRYSVQSKVQRLPIERISQASANQRAGRCGRVAPGICIRLYSEEDFNSRPAFTEPEIQRTNLSAVILQMMMLRLGDIADFPFVERPDPRAINDGFSLLQELGALDRHRQLTETGRRMAHLPTDPRLSCMLVEADARQCLHDMLIIVSALSVQDPREFPADKKQAAREKHRQYSHPDSDFLSWVRLWNAYEEQRQALGQSALKQYCRDNFLNFMRMREWRETHRQLTLSCQPLGLNTRESTPSIDTDAEPAQARAHYAALHRAILRGSLNQLGQKTPENIYLGARGRKFVLLPGSTLYKAMPKWIVVGELIETHRLFASAAARIEPEWAAEAAAHLVKREHFEAHWEKKRGQVVAWEKVSLYGLTLIERQRVDFSKIDQALSREIFVREALVEGELNTRAAFFRHNQQLIDEIRKQEEKQRRPDILISDDQLYAFYASRIPETICDSRSLEQWLKKAGAEALLMQREDLLRRPLDETVAQEFPDHADIGDNRLRINYRFTPGTDDDGASIDVPVLMLNRVTELELEWAVPGQVRERGVALIKALPKSVRKQFIPIAEFVEAALEGSEPGRERLVTLLDRQAKRKGIKVDPKLWEQVSADSEALPAWLRTGIRVVDAKGHEIGREDSLQNAQRRFAQSPVEAAPLRHPLEQEGLREWTFGVLPREVHIEQGIRLIRYPALIDNGESVSIRLLENAQEASELSERGLIRLLIFRTPQQRAAIIKLLQQADKRLALKRPPELKVGSEDALFSIYGEAFDIQQQPRLPADEQAFEKLLEAGKGDLIRTAEQMAGLLEQVYEQLFQVRRMLPGLENPETAYATADVRAQLSELLYPDYLAETPWQWLKHYPRYLKAIALRLEKVRQNLTRDREAMTDIQTLKKQAQESVSKAGTGAPGWQQQELRWLLEELRVSLFAQSLRTAVPVSVQRLQKRLNV